MMQIKDFPFSQAGFDARETAKADQQKTQNEQRQAESATLRGALSKTQRPHRANEL
jgi:hypothetical protein